MTVTLDLTPETEARLRLDAGDRGLDVKAHLQQYLDSLPKMTGADYGRLFSRPLTDEEARSRIDLMRSFPEQEEEDEGEPGWDLMRALADNPVQFREWSSEE